jgi:ABC-type lipoprotein release transport system permease subunit
MNNKDALLVHNTIKNKVLVPGFAKDENQRKAIETAMENTQKAFCKRYAVKPEIYSASDKDISHRKFVLGNKLASYTEIRKDDLTDIVVVSLGQKNSFFRTVLEAEVSIVDYLAEE